MRTIENMQYMIWGYVSEVEGRMLRDWAESIVRECGKTIQLKVLNMAEAGIEPDIVPEYECGDDVVVPAVTEMMKQVIESIK